MSTQLFEDGLVRLYIDKIAALGVKALQGADVKPEVAAVVDEAAKHFAVVKTSTEIGNLRWFAGQLGLRAEISHPTQPQYRATFEHAKGLADALVKSKQT